MNLNLPKIKFFKGNEEEKKEKIPEVKVYRKPKNRAHL